MIENDRLDLLRALIDGGKAHFREGTLLWKKKEIISCMVTIAGYKGKSRNFISPILFIIEGNFFPLLIVRWCRVKFFFLSHTLFLIGFQRV